MCSSSELDLTSDELDNVARITAKAAITDPCSLEIFDKLMTQGVGRFEALGQALFNQHLVSVLKLAMNEDAIK